MTYNFELQQIFGEPNRVKVIKDCQLRWVCHIYRYGDNNPVKKIIFQKTEGKTRRCGPCMAGQRENVIEERQCL